MTKPADDNLRQHFNYPEQQLLSKLFSLSLQPKTILLLGFQQQFLIQEIKLQYPEAKIFTDYSEQSSYFFDLIIVSQVSDFRFFSEAKNLLAKQGVIACNSLGPNSLIELRQAWQQIDELPHVNNFIDMHDLGDQLRDLHFANITLERQDINYQFEDVYQLLYTLKALGSYNEQGSQYLSKQCFEKLNLSYPREQDKCQVTVELIYVIAHQNENFELPFADSNGEVKFNIEQLRQSRKE